jgi:hypothetical protein
LSLTPAEETVEGNGSVWFGGLMRNARRCESRNCAKSNGDPGAIRGASLKGESRPLRSVALAFGEPTGMQGVVVVTRARFERATSSFGGWAAYRNS